MLTKVNCRDQRRYRKTTCRVHQQIEKDASLSSQRYMLRSGESTNLLRGNRRFGPSMLVVLLQVHEVLVPIIEQEVEDEPLHSLVKTILDPSSPPDSRFFLFFTQ